MQEVAAGQEAVHDHGGLVPLAQEEPEPANHAQLEEAEELPDAQ